MSRLTHQHIERIRQTPGQSLLLFITDRCPVECAHCSVDSNPDSPTISDFQQFGLLIDAMGAMPDVQVVGISGGEPFVEKRGLQMAVDNLHAMGKSLVIYTSGVWGQAERAPAWIQNVLQKTSTVVLSTDAFHQAHVDPATVIHAARAIADAGVWLVVQTLHPGMAKTLMEQAFGHDWPHHGELVSLSPLPNGRGALLFQRTLKHWASDIGPCALAVTPVVRYDGQLTACCNEDVIMGKGPQRLRQQLHSPTTLHTQLKQWRKDPLLGAVARIGPGLLLEHPQLEPLQNQRCSNACEVCWKVMAQWPEVPCNDRLVTALNSLEPAIES